MDTPTIAQYYKEIDPLKRKKFLERSIAENEDPEKNPVRLELWSMRYKEAPKHAEVPMADGFMNLLMHLEINRNRIKSLFGSNGAKKEIASLIKKLGVVEFEQKGELYHEVIYREYCHLVQTYFTLCMEDKTYGSAFMGLVQMKKENLIAKMKKDIYETFIKLPVDAGLREELKTLAQAARDVYALQFPEDGPLPDPDDYKG